MAMFKAFKPSGIEKIARSMGYQGNMQGFQDYIAQDPMRQQQMQNYTNKAMEMAKGGYAKKYNKGGAVPPRRVDIKGQDHMLAYITPEEGELLKAHGGSGKPGPMGIPSFAGDDGPDPSSGFKDDQYGNLWYYVQDTPGDNAETRAVRVGSYEDTAENRQLAAETNPHYNQGISEKFKQIEARQPRQSRKEYPDPYEAEEEAAAEQVEEDAQAAAQQAAAQQAAIAQQQYSQQVAAQMQNAFGTNPQPYVPPIYQAPYLSGTQFTPAGQYVQDPNTGQPVPVAYTPLNQGYAAAANNFYQQVYGGYGTPQTQYLGGFGGLQRNSLYNPNTASAIGNLAGSMLTQNMAEGGYVKNKKVKYFDEGGDAGYNSLLTRPPNYSGSADDYSPSNFNPGTVTTPAGPPQYQPPAPTIPPAKKTTMMLGEEDSSGGDFIAKTMAVGEDDPNPNPPPTGYTKALGEDGNMPTLARGGAEAFPGLGNRPIMATTQAVGEEDNLFNPGLATQAVGEQPGSIKPIASPVTMAIGEDDPNFTNNIETLPVADMPVTINGITYNSFTRAVGETSSPPPPPNQPLQQAATGQQQLNPPSMNIGVFGGPGTGGFSGSLFLSDTSRPKSEQELRQEFDALVAQEKAEAAKGGPRPAVVTPGQMAMQMGFEKWKAADNNKYKMMRNPDAPDSLYAGFDMTGIRDPRMSTGQQQPNATTGRPGGQVTNPAGTQAGTPVYTGASPTQYDVTPATYYQEGDELPEGVEVGDEKTPEIRNPVPGVAQFSVEQMYNPALPIGGTTIAAQTQTDSSQDIAEGTGELTGSVSVPTATASTTQAQGITPTDANIMQAAQAAPAVDSAMNATQAAQADPNNPNAQITAAQQTASSVGNLQAAQGNASLINNPVQRQIQAGELISGVANAQTASQFTEQIQAAQATPSQQATVQGQLNNLMQQFQGGNTPAWAAGAMRSVTSAMAARGLSASSLAGQAMVQAAMESALPIAQADAQTQAQFEGQNLSNRQQRAMLAAEQRARFMGQEFDQAFQSRVQNSARIGDIANMNFTAEQQVQLENSRAVNTMNLNNLSNLQAMVMAEAAALAQLDTANLSNRQQSAVQNAQNFLQYDMANLSNRQQTELFKAQQRVQSLFTDQAATNAARQFNATSQNQVDQFFASLGAQVSQFNATQQNAQAQFNAGQTNTVNRFNAELNNQRDQFNATNQLVIAQSNAQWRRQIATADTAAVNRANELNANAILDISKTAYNNLWNYYGDTMEWAWKSANSELDRMNNLAIAQLSADASAAASAAQRSSAAGSALGSLLGTLGTAAIKYNIFCWVAREVYGPDDYTWLLFRNWLVCKAPNWFRNLYINKGESFAKYISNKPLLKKAIKFAMNQVIKDYKMEYKRANN